MAVSSATAPNFAALWRRPAEYVARILRGAKPAELPIEQPTLFEFAVNLKTAKALGLIIPGVSPAARRRGVRIAFTHVCSGAITSLPVQAVQPWSRRWDQQSRGI
jgi:hypothetical protein